MLIKYTAWPPKKSRHEFERGNSKFSDNSYALNNVHISPPISSFKQSRSSMQFIIEKQ